MAKNDDLIKIQRGVVSHRPPVDEFKKGIPSTPPPIAEIPNTPINPAPVVANPAPATQPTGNPAPVQPANTPVVEGNSGSGTNSSEKL